MKMTNIFKVATVFLLLIISVGCGSAQVDEILTKTNLTLYTRVNIWYTNRGKIPSSNYHIGAIIPAGTPVQILDANSSAIKFKARGGEYRLIFVERHSGGTLIDFFNRMFAEQPPSLARFSAIEKKAIQQGVLANGLSKEATIVAYGYPPVSKTESMDADKWTYPIKGFRSIDISFKNNRIAGLKTKDTPDSNKNDTKIDKPVKPIPQGNSTVTLKNGKVYNNVTTKISGNSVTIIQNDGSRVSLPKTEIRRIQLNR